jgi:hypothetical protein
MKSLFQRYQESKEASKNIGEVINSLINNHTTEHLQNQPSLKNALRILEIHKESKDKLVDSLKKTLHGDVSIKSLLFI